MDDVATREKDRVRDGRHLMNGTRWVTGDAFEPPEGMTNVIGVRMVDAHARVTGGVMDDTIRLRLPPRYRRLALCARGV